MFVFDGRPAPPLHIFHNQQPPKRRSEAPAAVVLACARHKHGRGDLRFSQLLATTKYHTQTPRVRNELLTLVIHGVNVCVCAAIPYKHGWSGAGVAGLDSLGNG